MKIPKLFITLEKLKIEFTNYKPDLVLVQGDTTSAMASSLAAFYEKIPIGHVEAGLRTHNKFFPYPEEINRQLISKICDFHFTFNNYLDFSQNIIA